MISPAFEEALAAVDAVRHRRLQQGLFQHARLGVAAVQDGAVVQRPAVVLPCLDAVDHEARFVEFVEGTVDGDRFAFAAFGPQVFAHAPVVVGDQGVGRFQDVAGGTVVLLRADGFRTGEIFQEALDVFHLRAAPAVDRLVIVTDDHHVAVAARQQTDPAYWMLLVSPNSSTSTLVKRSR